MVKTYAIIPLFSFLYLAIFVTPKNGKYFFKINNQMLKQILGTHSGDEPGNHVAESLYNIPHR